MCPQQNSRQRIRQPLDRRAMCSMQGGGLQLRPPQVSDAPALYRYTADPLASRFLGWLPHRDEGECVQFLQGCHEAWQGAPPEVRLPWVILAGEAVVGMIEAKLRGRNAGIGYVVAPAAWGRGYATEALSVVSEALFRHSPVSAIWALCVTANPASARVLEKCGYQRESLLPNYVVCPNLDGQRHDVWRYVRYRDPAPTSKTAVKPV